MPGVGEQLQRAREAQDLSLDEIAGSTRIGRAYLEALEEGRYEALPGRAFGKLYIRAYADKLGFDPSPLLQEYETELRSWQKPDEVRDRPEPGRRRVGNAIAAWREGLIAERERELAAERGETIEAEPVQVEAEESVEPVEDPAEADPAAAAEEPFVEPVAFASEPEEPEIATEPVDVDEPTEAVPPAPTARRGGVAASVRAPGWLVGLAAAILLAILLLIGSGIANGDDVVTDASVPLAIPETTTVDPVDDPLEGPVVPETRAPSQSTAPTETKAPEARPPSRLEVTEHGVGSKVVSHRLQDPGDRFTEGDVVAFQTRVVGGRPGDRVRHVWLRDGRVQQSIALRLGSASFRTHSTKTLWGTGDWVVEARDSSGRVLARNAFVCVPR